MSHRLYLLRHAKSSWEDLGLADHDRPLAQRGRKAAALLSEHFGRAGVAPDLVLCSSAARARETLDGVRAGLDRAARIEIEAGLYGAGSERLLTRLRVLSEDVGSAMLIGHNPAIETLAAELSDEDHADAEARKRMEAKYPTGALATLGFDGPWNELDWDGARLEAFVIPKQLR